MAGRQRGTLKTARRDGNQRVKTAKASFLSESSSRGDLFGRCASMNTTISTGSGALAAKKMTLPLALGLVVFQSLFNFGAMGALSATLVPDPEHPFAPSLALVLIMLLSSAVVLPVLWYFCLARPRRSARELGWNFDKPVQTVAFGVLGAALCLGVLTAILLGLGTPLTELLQQIAARGASHWLTFLFIGVTAAVAEETLFRGNLQQALETKMRPLFAAPLCALVFALYHLSPSPVSLVFKFSLGMVCWFARVRGGSLVAPAIAHALFWFVAGDL
jgi:membrane protease YdiL (CAAX protease family)